MSNTGLQYGLYQQTSSLANLVDQVLLERRREKTASSAQERLGNSLSRILETGGVPELAWRVVALRLRNKPELRSALTPEITRALTQGEPSLEVIPFLEHLAEILEVEQVQTVARMRG